MKLAKITREKNALFVEYDGYSYRRIACIWEMKSNAGNWFPCEIQSPHIRTQVADFENCLRSYRYEEGPEYPTGRRGTPVGEYIRQRQLADLRKGGIGIFAPVNVKPYDASAENKKRVAAEMRTRLRAPMPAGSFRA